LKKIFIHIFRFFFWAYAMLGYILVMSLVPLILLGLLLNPITSLKILDNVLALSNVILGNGLVGLLVIALYGGQFFLSYYLYKKLSKFV
tara:strand:+ start:5502 stop:5768 length:267 start_codon:yes stop_codon:yes gene_type:complete